MKLGYVIYLLIFLYLTSFLAIFSLVTNFECKDHFTAR